MTDATRLVAAGGRDRAMALAATDWTRAAALARTIADPWYRAQALAAAARHAPDAGVVPLARAALAAGAEAREGYGAVAVGAWPLRALVERGHHAEAAETLAVLLPAAAAVTPPVSRVAALALLWAAAFPLGAEARRIVMDALRDGILDPRATAHWRTTMLLADIARTLPADEAAPATTLLEALQPGKLQRRVARELEHPVRRAPRPFFEAGEPHHGVDAR